MTAYTGPSDAIVVERRRCPGIGFMAILADIARCKVVSRFTCSFGAVVAAYTGPRDAAVVERRRRPGIGFVAILADIVCREMVCRFTTSLGAVVARDAI